MKRTKLFKAGDIIENDRILYKHYGIYDGDGKVIHYSADNNYIGIGASVKETSLERFVKGGNCKLVRCIKNRSKIRIFSPEETVSRARSRLGEKKYNLVFNNCEHFALWCKYGKNKSIQVDKAIGTVVILGVAVIISQLVKNIDDEG